MPAQTVQVDVVALTQTALASVLPVAAGLALVPFLVASFLLALVLWTDNDTGSFMVYTREATGCRCSEESSTRLKILQFVCVTIVRSTTPITPICIVGRNGLTLGVGDTMQSHTSSTTSGAGVVERAAHTI